MMVATMLMPMTVLVPMAMLVIVIVMMAVPRATFRSAGQRAGQVPGDQRLHRNARLASSHFDALLGEKIKRPPADAADDDRADPLLMEPARKQAGLMFGGRDYLRAKGGFGVGIHFDHRKFAAAAEVVMEAAVIMWYGNFHRWFSNLRFTVRIFRRVPIFRLLDHFQQTQHFLGRESCARAFNLGHGSRR